MNECFGKYFVLNGQLLPAEAFDISMVYEGESIYEVLRIVRGLPVFFYDHVTRLEASARFQNRTVLRDTSVLRNDIAMLLASETRQEINIKIVFNYSNGRTNCLLYFIEPIYPSPEQYRKGVPAILYHAERKDPESKLINHKLRSEIYHRLIMENAYEALLVNRDNCITEGSRSNVFFIRADKLYTAPEKMVLSGITRKHIIEICNEKGIGIEFGCMRAETLPEYESAFMTGTSPVVLPFSWIGDIKFNVKHSLIPLLRQLYLEKAEESMRKFESEISTPGEHIPT